MAASPTPRRSRCTTPDKSTTMETRDRVSEAWEAWAEASTPMRSSPCSSVEAWAGWVGAVGAVSAHMGEAEDTRTSHSGSDDVLL